MRIALLGAIPTALVGLVLAAWVPGSVQRAYLSSSAESTQKSVDATASLVLATPRLRAEVARSGPAILLPLFRSDVQTVGLTALSIYSAPAGHSGRHGPTVGGGALPVVVGAAFSTGEPAARLAPATAGRGPASIDTAVPIRQGPQLLAVIRGFRSGAALQREVASEVRTVDLVIGGALGAVWLAGLTVVRRRGKAARGRRPAPVADRVTYGPLFDA